MSRELGLNRRRFCLGLAENVAAVPLSCKCTRQRPPLRPRLWSSGDSRARGIADARGLGEASCPLIVGPARLLNQFADGRARGCARPGRGGRVASATAGQHREHHGDSQAEGARTETADMMKPPSGAKQRKTRATRSDVYRCLGVAPARQTDRRGDSGSGFNAGTFGRSGGDVGEQVVDDKGWPQDGFDDGPHMGPESGGVLPVVDKSSDESQTVDCASTAAPHNRPCPRRSRHAVLPLLDAASLSPPCAGAQQCRPPRLALPCRSGSHSVVCQRIIQA